MLISCVEKSRERETCSMYPVRALGCGSQISSTFSSGESWKTWLSPGERSAGGMASFLTGESAPCADGADFLAGGEPDGGAARWRA